MLRNSSTNQIKTAIQKISAISSDENSKKPEATISLSGKIKEIFDELNSTHFSFITKMKKTQAMYYDFLNAFHFYDRKKIKKEFDPLINPYQFLSKTSFSYTYHTLNKDIYSDSHQIMINNMLVIVILYDVIQKKLNEFKIKYPGQYKEFTKEYNTIDDLMIEPVQRLPRIILLLNTMMKHITPEEQEGSMIKTVSLHITSELNAFNNLKAMTELSNLHKEYILQALKTQTEGFTFSLNKLLEKFQLDRKNLDQQIEQAFSENYPYDANLMVYKNNINRVISIIQREKINHKIQLIQWKKENKINLIEATEKKIQLLNNAEIELINKKIQFMNTCNHSSKKHDRIHLLNNEITGTNKLLSTFANNMHKNDFFTLLPSRLRWSLPQTYLALLDRILHLVHQYASDNKKNEAYFTFIQNQYEEIKKIKEDFIVACLNVKKTSRYLAHLAASEEKQTKEILMNMINSAPKDKRAECKTTELTDQIEILKNEALYLIQLDNVIAAVEQFELELLNLQKDEPLTMDIEWLSNQRKSLESHRNFLKKQSDFDIKKDMMKTNDYLKKIADKIQIKYIDLLPMMQNTFPSSINEANELGLSPQTRARGFKM